MVRGSDWLDNALALRDAAAAESLAAIDHDRAVAPVWLRPLLTYIRQHLFDPELTVARMRRACRCGDNAISTRFGRRLGRPPRAYVRRHRLDTAARLLRDSNLPIHRIAELTAFSSHDALTQAFRRYAGEPPRSFRERGWQLPQPDVTAMTPAVVERILAGRATADQARALIARLEAAYPAITVDRGATGDPPAFPDRLRAAGMWILVRDRPFLEQRSLVRGAGAAVPAFFELLCEQSRAQGRLDKRRRIELAEVALASVEATGEATEADTRRGNDLRARAWAWLGNAHRLALDFPAAEQAFVRAEECLQVGAGDPIVAARVVDLKAALRWYQTRFEEALALEEEAIGVLRREGTKSALADALLIHAAIQVDAGSPAKGIVDLQEVIEMLDPSDQPYRLLCAHQKLANIYVALGEVGAARQQLGAANELADGVGAPGTKPFLIWLAGLIAQEAGDLRKAISRLGEARSAFLESNESLWLASVSLDLAIVLLTKGDVSAAVSVLEETIPVLDHLAVVRDGLVARRLLDQALAGGLRQVSALQAIKARLEKLSREPGTRLAFLGTPAS